MEKPIISRATKRRATQPKLRIIPLGGLREIGKNMTVLEYGNDIVVIDMGLMFPRGDSMPGVDYLIPDVSYLEKNKSRIRGVIITHGHLDHTGAIPYVIGKLGFPTVYGTPVTLGMVKGRLAEFNLVETCRFHALDDDADSMRFGGIAINSFRLLHNIPGEIGLEIVTPNGRVAFCSDWKFDYNPADGKGVDFQRLAAMGSAGVDLLISDSTGADKPGHTVSEKVVEESLSKAVETIKGRLVIAMLSTMLNRVQQVINIAARNNRRVYVSGRSMAQNVEMAVGIGAIVAPPGVLIPENEVRRYPADKLIVLTTGSQGEDNAALGRMARHEHRVIKLRKGDTVMLSASLIPGNEAAVGELKGQLAKSGATVITQKYLDMDIHASGHACQEDLKLMIALMRPRFFMPMHGEPHHLEIHRALAAEVGVKAENIINGDNGTVLELGPGGVVSVRADHVPAGFVAIDGRGAGDVNEAVIKERQKLGQAGFVHVACAYDSNTKRLVEAPQVVSRGFVPMPQNEALMSRLKEVATGIIRDSLAISAPDLEERVSSGLQAMLSELTGRQPEVIARVASLPR